MRGGWELADRHFSSCACNPPATLSSKPFSNKIESKGRSGLTASVIALSARSWRALSTRAASDCSNAMDAAAPAMHWVPVSDMTEANVQGSHLVACYSATVKGTTQLIAWSLMPWVRHDRVMGSASRCIGCAALHNCCCYSLACVAVP